MSSVKPNEFTPRSIAAAIAAWAGFLTGPNTMVSAVVGFFIKPVSYEFHLSRTGISLLTIIPPLTIALFVPLAGRAIDRWGARAVILPGLVAFAFSQFLMSHAHSPIELGIAAGAVGITAAFDSSVGYVKVISLWFSRSRGLVLGLVVAFGAGAGSAAMPQIVHRLIDHYGWRGAYIGVGTIILAIGLPTIWLLLRTPVATITESNIVRVAGITRRQAYHRLDFWCLFFAIFFASMSLIGTVAHLFPMLTERGFQPQTATSALSFLFIGSILGQATSGFWVDRLETSKAAIPFFAAALVGLLIEHSVMKSPTIYLGSTLAGIGQGGEIALAGYLTSRYFGLRHFGAIYSMVFGGSSLGICVGIVAMGICHDAYGSYAPIRVVFGGAMAVSLLLISSLGPYRYTKFGVPLAAEVTELAIANGV